MKLALVVLTVATPALADPIQLPKLPDPPPCYGCVYNPLPVYPPPPVVIEVAPRQPVEVYTPPPIVPVIPFNDRTIIIERR